MNKVKNTKVTMNLTKRDVTTTENLKKSFNTRSKTATVSAALSVAKTIIDLMSGGNELLVRRKSGEVEKIIIAGIN